MARAVLRQIVFGLATTGFLTGCVEGGKDGTAANGSTVAAAPAKKKGGSAEVEAPEIFQTTDSALWDGRPSLGGIWVAAPEVTNPERALMFNPATGKSVTGALFRRERENPGPRLQLSSDAAEALGILAGQPTQIRVTALRKEKAEEAAPEPAPAKETAEVAAAEGEAAGDTAAKPATSAETAAIASAALDAVDAGGDTAAAAAPAATEAAGETAEAGAAAAGAAAATGATVATEAVDGKPARKTWKERRAEAKAAREARKKAEAEAKAAASGEAAGAAATEAPATAAGVAAIETAPLDARSPEVSTAAESAAGADPTKVTVPKTAKPAPAAVAETAPEPAATGTEASSTSTGSRPIQVASFSKEDNAKRAAEALAKIDITATPQKSDQGGKAVWGVVVMGDDAMLKKIKDAGFADAYFLK
jgi:hypothetical protein